MGLNVVTVNSAITACMTVQPSLLPVMIVVGDFTAFACNTQVNHEGRQHIESMMIKRWKGLNRLSGHLGRCIFLTRDASNLFAVKLLFINRTFSASFLFGNEVRTGCETVAFRGSVYTTIQTLSEAIALLDVIVEGKTRVEALEGLDGVLGDLKSLGFKKEGGSDVE